MRIDDPLCPFCGAAHRARPASDTRRRLTRAAAFVFGASVASACGSSVQIDGGEGGGGQTVAASSSQAASSAASTGAGGAGGVGGAAGAGGEGGLGGGGIVPLYGSPAGGLVGGMGQGGT